MGGPPDPVDVCHIELIVGGLPGVISVATTPP